MRVAFELRATLGTQARYPPMCGLPSLLARPVPSTALNWDLTLLELEQYLIISALESNCTNHNNEGMKEDIVWAS